MTDTSAQIPAKKPRSQREHPERRTVQTERSRRDILDAAMRVIAEYGFHESTIDLIAEAAGISPTSIYWHFGNREGLLGALAHRISDRYVEIVAAEIRGEQLPPEAHIKRFLAAVTRSAIEHPEIIRAQTALSSEGALLPAVREGVRERLRRSRSPVIQIVDDGVASGIFQPIRGDVWLDFVVGSLAGASIQSRLHHRGFDPCPGIEAVHIAALRLLGLEAEPTVAALGGER